MQIEVKQLPAGTETDSSEQVGRFTREECNSSRNPLEATFGEKVYQSKVLMNVQNCQYLDSTGVGWLLSCHKRFQEGGGKLIVHSASPALMQILKLMRMDLVLTLADTEQKARTLALGEANVH